MKLSIEDTAALKAEFKGIGRQAPFALSLAINNTGLAAQKAARGEVARSFSLRGTGTFFDRGVVFNRGTKAKPTAVLSVGVDSATKGGATARASMILARHEQAGTRESTEVVRAGGKLVEAGFFLPGPGLRTASTNVPRRLYPSAIGATIRVDPAGKAYYASNVKQKGRGQRQVRDAYFVIPRVGIFQRQSGGLGSKVRPIWFFARRVRTPARTGFQRMAEETIEDRWEIEARNAIARALETAR
jgi:hypothetical protein